MEEVSTNEPIVILPLTQDNLSRNTKEPQPANLYHVGISYDVNKKDHVRFSDEESLKGIASNSFPFQKLSMNLYFSMNKYLSNRKLDKYTLHRSPPKELAEIPSNIWLVLIYYLYNSLTLSLGRMKLFGHY